MSSIEAFFDYARARQTIYLKRQASLPEPWTDDYILQKYRFTNVFREDDRTTVWFRENVRSRYSGSSLLLATVIFRWFNRITTGETLFLQPNMLDDGRTPFEAYLATGHSDYLRAPLMNQAPPYVTGAYIIKTPDGYKKLDGVLKCIEWFTEQEHAFPAESVGSIGWRDAAEIMVNSPDVLTLECIWDWLRKFPFLGDFMAYEIVTDLRHTPLLNQALDIMTWANPGPGATRGIGRVLWGDKDMYNQHRDKQSLIRTMQDLLEKSKDAGYWPQLLPHMEDNSMYSNNCEYDRRFGSAGDWPAWEMRDVEHTLCEFDKYERARTGEGRPRGTFR